MTKIINVAKDFSRYPYGRLRQYSETSGEAFREDILIPALKESELITVVLDGTEGYGSSFLDEAFANLIRKNGFKKEDVLRRISFKSKDDPTLITEILSYINAT
jgi:hypothetical protein